MAALLPATLHGSLGVEYDSTGTGYRSWKSVSDNAEPVEYTRWPLSGTRVAEWYVRALSRTNMEPSARHNLWSSENRLAHDDKHAMQRGELTDVLELLGHHDQLDLSNLAGVELLTRYLMRHEHEIRKRVDANVGQGEEMSWWTGRATKAGGALVAPALTKELAGNASAQASIMKETRRYEEERVIARKKKNEPPAGGKKE